MSNTIFALKGARTVEVTDKALILVKKRPFGGDIRTVIPRDSILAVSHAPKRFWIDQVVVTTLAGSDTWDVLKNADELVRLLNEKVEA